MEDMVGLKIIQISNVPIQATKDQMYAMFECIGDIEDIQLYPKKRCTSFQSRICFIKFSSTASVELAHYLNDTHLMDRLLQVTPFFDGKRERGEIPSEKKALEILMNDSCQMNPHDTEAEGELSSDIQKVVLELQRNGLPPYPSLPFNCDSANVEEIRRTIVVSNLDELISGQQVLEHFSGVGEVKYIRFCKRNSNGEFCCLVEFSKHESVIPSLKLNNTEIVKGRKVKLASSLIEAVCQESVGERNSENIGLDHQLSSPSRVYSKSDSPSSRRSHKYKKYNYERQRHRSKERRSKSSSCSGRSKSQGRRRHTSRERRRSCEKSSRESKRSGSKGRSSRSPERKREKSKSKDRSLEGEKKSGEISPKERSKSLSGERPKSRERIRSRSRQERSRSKNWRSRRRRSRSKSASRFRKKSKSRERSRERSKSNKK
ncbi:hypothetical protein J437_LFUL018857 [Ladona fulva]|uniref:RRM domain-containing protein n=1 Tax=Ladona fulva TaxID=123851 RepID=A0A8K0P9T4_LADFU|nr:hypothetical protein J437_LFUL018857 [Ladona fulva]